MALIQKWQIIHFLSFSTNIKLAQLRQELLFTDLSMDFSLKNKLENFFT
jgi:hypothetical protein